MRLRGNPSSTSVLSSTDPSKTTWDATGTSTDTFTDIFYPIVGDGSWRTTYASFQNKHNNGTLARTFSSNLKQIRVYPAVARPADSGTPPKFPSSVAPARGETFNVDWIRLVNSPVIERVTGCYGEKYSDVVDFAATSHCPQGGCAKMTTSEKKINTHLSHYKTVWERRPAPTNVDPTPTFARSFNCLRRGGERITVEGRNFGGEPSPHGGGGPTTTTTSTSTFSAVVLIGGRPCTDVRHDPAAPQERLTCVTPPMGALFRDNDVTVMHGRMPGLNDTASFFEYAKEPASPVGSSVSNVAATAADVSWTPGGSAWDAMAQSGFAVYWRKAVAGSAIPAAGSATDVWSERQSVVVGNVRTTTLIGLEADTLYDVAVAGLSENQGDPEWQALDKYGRRRMLDGAIVGARCATLRFHTLGVDINFPYFNANLTTSVGAMDKSGSRATYGPTGVTGGEGHYGLLLIGDANVENCNASAVCCDLAGPTVAGNPTGTWPARDDPSVLLFESAAATCKPTTMTCSAAAHPNPKAIDGVSVGRRVPDNLASGGEKWVGTYSTMMPLVPTYGCGPALRLTGSGPQLSGSAWYGRQQEVGEGFDTTFRFRISNPSFHCSVMDDVHTNCRSRGGDGFAFVIQANGQQALGGEGKAMGYGGITNSLAVEFDTYYNPELSEPYENHVSVHTRGWRERNSPSQSYSLGTTNEVPDLTDGFIDVRIKYVPIFDEILLKNPHFMPSYYVSNYLENSDFADGGMPDWGNGLGLLSVYVNNLREPCLLVPLNLESTLALNHGRAWVGFTSATGDNTWQAHDIMSWTFASLRTDQRDAYMPPVVVNGEGAFTCTGDLDNCRHP